MTNVNWMKISRISDFYIILSNIYLWYTKSVLIRPRLFWGEFHPSYLQGIIGTLFLFHGFALLLVQLDTFHLHIALDGIAGLPDFLDFWIAT